MLYLGASSVSECDSSWLSWSIGEVLRECSFEVELESELELEFELEPNLKLEWDFIIG